MWKYSIVNLSLAGEKRVSSTMTCFFFLKIYFAFCSFNCEIFSSLFHLLLMCCKISWKKLTMFNRQVVHQIRAKSKMISSEEIILDNLEFKRNFIFLEAKDWIIFKLASILEEELSKKVSIEIYWLFYS